MEPWWKVVLTYPATWPAVASVVVVEWLFLSVVEPPPILALISVVVALVSIVFWPISMAITGTLARLQFPLPKFDEIDPAELDSIRLELDGIDDPRPRRQFDAVQDKRDNLKAVLERRLDAGELTFARYVSAAEAVYRSTLDSLHEVAVASRSVSTIDRDELESRLVELRGVDGESAERERESLESRVEISETQGAKIDLLLAQNEAALTALDRTAVALADAPMGRTPADAEAAMEALEALAERTSRYVDT